MIINFADRPTESTFRQEDVRHIDSRIQRAALRKLLMIDAAVVLTDLLVPPGNRLEALKGKLAGRHSIRVNDQWRIVFIWKRGNAQEVQLADYH